MTLESLVRRIEGVSHQVPPKQTIVGVIDEFWALHAAMQAGQSSRESIWEAAVLTAAGSDRPWLGGAVAIQGAIHHLLTSVSHPLERRPGDLVAFCASEIGGNRPRAIETTMVPDATEGGYAVTGTKRWSTLGPLASHLLVIVSEGADEARNHLRAILLPADRNGVFIEEMTIAGNVQANLRLPHSLVTFEQVKVFDAEVLPGDGYSTVLKPFRTIEDLYGYSARVSALLSLGFRHGASAAEVEGLIALLAGLRSLLGEDLSSSTSHLVVGAAESSLPELGRAIVERLPPETSTWWMSDGEVQVATSAKTKRREAALARLLAP